MADSSTILPPAQLQVHFSNITYSVKGFFTKGRKEILHGVSGLFRSGELSAIMGPSGAGKSTLLNVLAGYKEDYMGEVEVEGGDSSRKCYIMQEENLHPLLTISEVMEIASRLKLGPSVAKKQRQLRITDILNSLGLSANANTLTVNLSGGQRKRLGIALELIDNPKVMFFDEPTSGLDSSSTKQCVKLLKDLAREGRVIVFTIHQPSATVFNEIDLVYCIASGNCAYSGSPSNVTPFLCAQGLVCPQYHNPADFLMEVCSGDYGDYLPKISNRSKNGKCLDWRKHSISWTEPIVTAESKELLMIEGRQTYPTSFPRQTAILISRNWTTLLRDQFLMHSRLFIHTAIGILMGAFFYDIGADAGKVFSNFNVLFFSVMFLTFTALQCISIAFPLEKPIIRKEYFNCWYSVKAYYLASTLADLPIQIACVVIYTTIVYWMSGQPQDIVRFSVFTFIAILTSILSQSIGYLVGACANVKVGVLVGPMCILPWVLFSGFFLQAKDAPAWASWIYTISWMRRGIEGLTATVYGYSREPLPCISEDYCHFVSPTKFLKELDMADNSVGSNILIILGFSFCLKYMTYIVLVYQLKTQR